jgi:hypothetical protein
MVCPECGELLRNKEILYEIRMEEICSELGVNYNMVSQEGIERNETYIKKRQEIVNELCDNICCKMNLITYIPIVNIIKG